MCCAYIDVQEEQANHYRPREKKRRRRRRRKLISAIMNTHMVALFQMKSRTEITLHHGNTSCTDTLSPRVLKLHRRSSRNETQPNTRQLPDMGASDKSYVVLHGIMYSQSHAQLYLKEAWENLKKISVTKTTAQKLQLCQ